MIRNYLKIAWRNLKSNKVFALINILGLTVGITVCLLMVLFLKNELSYDNFHSKANRIVRVIMEYKIGSEGSKGNFTSTKVFPTFQQNFPEVESGVRMMPAERIVKFEDKIFNEPNLIFADSTFFEVFDFDLLKGKASEVLKAPYQVVITQNTARKLFGNEDPINKTVLIGSRQQPFVVTGISKETPQNSQIKYDYVASISSFGPLQTSSYFNANYTTYLLLSDGVSLKKLQTKINDFMKKELASDNSFEIFFELEPMLDIHLRSPYNSIVPNLDIAYIYIIGGMAIMLLLIACFTYINLSTARFIDRAKEVGVRKSLGAVRGQLFGQFIIEITLITAISLILSYFLAFLLLPYFNQLSNLNLSASVFFSTDILMSGIVFLILISLLSGFYPSFIISKYHPARVLKGSFKRSNEGSNLGKVLTITQFSASILMLIMSFLVGEQVNYIQNKNLGFEKDNILVIPADSEMMAKRELIKSELMTIPNVVTVSGAYNSPINILGGYDMSGADPNIRQAVTANPIDENYLTACGIKLIAGRNITKQDVEMSNDGYYNFILNESAAKDLGWTPQEAIGKRMYLGESRPGEVAGVVRDFNFKSIHSPIRPLVLFPDAYPLNFLVKLSGNEIPQSLKEIESKMNEVASHRPFEFTFLNQDYQKMYESETRTKSVISGFSTIAIFLAGIGLFGLSTFMIRKRTKEIGIRKVMGASAFSIAYLLSKDFIKLVLVAFIIAAPLAYWLGESWLEDFSYRINIGSAIFIVTVVIVLLISLGSVSFQAINAALANPVKSLRSE